MLTASLRIELPPETWAADVSREFPRATFRLLSGVQTGETAVELGEVRADDPERASAAVDDHPAVVDFERLEVTDARALSKYETTDTALYAFVEESGVPPEFPLTVRDGWFELDFTGTREAFDGFRPAWTPPTSGTNCSRSWRRPTRRTC